MKNALPEVAHQFLSAWRRCDRLAGSVGIILLLTVAGISAQTKSLVIAVEDDAAPWSAADGTGYANDVVIAAFKAVGVEVELRVVPYARCKRMAINGEVAGCLSMSPSPEFAGLIDLSARPLFSCYAGYFYNVNRPPSVRRQEDLPPKTVVGTVIGYEYPTSLNELRQKGVVVLEESPSEESNLKKLALGRVDLALLTYNEMKSPEWLVARAGVEGKVKTAFNAGTLSSYIGFSKKHPQGTWALQQFNRGFRLIIVNGTMQRVKKNWLLKLQPGRAARRR